jgi:N-acetylglutamate synthase-like GNAT family acetyltransferase
MLYTYDFRPHSDIKPHTLFLNAVLDKMHTPSGPDAGATLAMNRATSQSKPMIRTAHPADIPALHALVESAYRGDSARQGWTHEADLLDGQRTDPGRLAAQLADPAETVLVIEGPGGGLDGCVAISDLGAGAAMLGMLAVRPMQQGGGLGARLIAAAEADAQTRLRAHTMKMTVIPHRLELIAFYERRGYRATGETKPFPAHDPGFGLPKVNDLAFIVLAKPLAGQHG